MTVPKSLRSESKLHVHVVLRKLVSHTLTKTKNKSKFGGSTRYEISRNDEGEITEITVFESSDRRSLAARIENAAIMAGECAWRANDLHLESEFEARRKLQEQAIYNLDALSSQYSGAVGYKPGSQLVQIAGIDYLDKLDHHIKERLRVRYYGRYMDDLVMLSTDRDELVSILSEIERELALIGMETHKKKTRIEPIEKPLTFLGFDYRIRDGCVSMIVTPKKVKEQRRSLRTLSRLVAKGSLSRDDYLASLECMVAHLSKGDSKTLPDRMNAYGHELIGDYIGC